MPHLYTRHSADRDLAVLSLEEVNAYVRIVSRPSKSWN